MSDIDSIIAGVSGNTRADFSGLGNLPKAYWEGRDQAAKNELRDAFKGGVPLTPDGQPDFGAMAKTLFQKGGLSEGTAAANLGLAQQNMQFGQGQSGAIQNFDRGGQSQAAPIVSPPSANRTASAVVAPPLNKGGVQGPGQTPQGQETPKSYLTKLGLQPGYNMEVGLASFKRNGIEPDQPFNPNDPNLAEVMPAMKRMGGIGQVQPPQPGDGQPMQAPQVAQAPMQPPQQAPQMQPQVPQPQMAGQPGPVTNALTTTQPSSEPSRAEKGIAFFSGIMADPRSPKQNVELAKIRLEAMTKDAALTDPQKEYAQAALQGFRGTMQQYQVTMAGQKSAAEEKAKLTGPQREYAQAQKQGFKGTLEDWQNRTDDNTTQRDILNKSTIPKLEKSQEMANSSIQDIDAIHRARAEIDQPGGAITGVWATDKLKLAKIGNYLGISDADKITNTEAFMAAAGKRVAAMVKAFGSGTAISDGDRKFAEKMAGGGIDLNETSIRRILDIGEQADRAIIDRHNEFADKSVKSNEGLKPARDTLIVQQPGQYKKPTQSAGVFDAARDAISKGAPRDAVMKRLKENGHDPTGL